jgi:hypothetical protein
LEKLLQKMDEYIRADNDFRQRREEAYMYSEMTRGFGGRLHPGHVRTIHNPNTNDDRPIILRAASKAHSLRECSKLPTSHQPREAEGGEALGEGMVISPGNGSAYYVGKISVGGLLRRRRSCEKKRLRKARTGIMPKLPIRELRSVFLDAPT